MRGERFLAFARWGQQVPEVAGIDKRRDFVDLGEAAISDPVSGPATSRDSDFLDCDPENLDFQIAVGEHACHADEIVE